MFQRILVPLDGSRRAESVLPLAVRLAAASGGTVFLLQVMPDPDEIASYISLQPLPSRLQHETDLARVTRYLQEMGQKALADTPTGIIVKQGDPTANILATVDEYAIDLIVMCSHGYSGLTRWTLGSIAEKVTHNTRVPVLLLRDPIPQSLQAPGQKEQPLRILVPLDGSPLAEEAILPAAQLVTAMAAPATAILHMLTVAIAPRLSYTATIEQTGLIERAKEYLETSARLLKADTLSRFIDSGQLTLTWSTYTRTNDIADGILHIADHGGQTTDAEKRHPYDLMAMATHGASGMQRWYMGSITERVLRSTTLPLLIVNSGAARAS